MQPSLDVRREQHSFAPPLPCHHRLCQHVVNTTAGIAQNRRNIYVINNSKINKIKKKSFKGQIHNFGNKNKNKTFYVIQREGIGGFFSNLL